MKTQKQRSAARKRQDQKDSMQAAARVGNRCEQCQTISPYVPGNQYAGSNHHDYRKNNNPELRHDPENHHWLCWKCHRAAHDDTKAGHKAMYAIRQRRGDTLPLHPRGYDNDL